MIDFACPRCGTAQRVTDGAAGQKIACAKCGQRLKVPDPPEMRTMQAAALTTPKPPPAKAGKQWYYQDGAKQRGPVTWAELKRMAADGDLSPEDMVWGEGMAGWKEAHRIPNLFPHEGAPADSAAEGKGKLLEGCGVLVFGGLGGLALLLFVGFLVWRGYKKAEADNPQAAATQADKELSTEQIVERSKPLVALVRSDLSNGTGFMARPGILVTNAHVVEDGLVEKLHIFFPSGGEAGKTPISAELLYEDRKRDLAILKVNGHDSALKVADKYDLKGGEKVIIIGNPGASAGENVTLENAVTLGVMSTQTTLNGLAFYQVSAAVNPGNSGGPLFDSHGQVIGVVTRKAVGKRQEGMGFAIPVADLHDALHKVDTQPKTEAARMSSHHDLVVVFDRLVQCGQQHGVAMSHFSKRMQEAVKDKRPAQEGWNQAKREIDDELKPVPDVLDRVMMTEVRPAIPRILKDPNLPESTRQNLDRLVATYTEMRGCLTDPKDVNTFSAKTRELRGAFAEQVKTLKALIGQEDDE